jgi:hypothetical protein
VSGRTRVAEALADEATQLSRATTGIHGTAGRGKVVILTSTGPEDQARAMATAHLREALERDQGTRGVIIPEHALCQMELGLGNYAAAQAHAERAFAMDFIGPQAAWNPSNLVEAAQRAGDRDTRPARRGRRVQSRNRHPVVHQRVYRGVSPARHIPQTRRGTASAAPRRASRQPHDGQDSALSIGVASLCRLGLRAELAGAVIPRPRLAAAPLTLSCPTVPSSLRACCAAAARRRTPLPSSGRIQLFT